MCSTNGPGSSQIAEQDHAAIVGQPHPIGTQVTEYDATLMESGERLGELDSDRDGVGQGLSGRHREPIAQQATSGERREHQRSIAGVGQKLNPLKRLRGDRRMGFESTLERTIEAIAIDDPHVTPRAGLAMSHGNPSTQRSRRGSRDPHKGT